MKFVNLFGLVTVLLIYRSGPTTSQSITPTQPPVPSIRITNRSGDKLAFGVAEGQIGVIFSVQKGTNVFIYAVYATENAGALVPTTSWSINGFQIQATFLFEGTKNGAPFRVYTFDFNGNSGFINRAINSNDEILQLNEVSLQINSSIGFMASLGEGITDVATSRLNVYSESPTTLTSSTPEEVTTMTSSTPEEVTTMTTITPEEVTTMTTITPEEVTAMTTITPEEVTTLSTATATATPAPEGPRIIITQVPDTDPPIEPSTPQNVEGPIGTKYYVREQSKIKIIADYIINTTEAAEPRTSWYYHSTKDGTRTTLAFELQFLPDGLIEVVTNSPWSDNSSYMIVLRADLRTEILEIPSAFPVHEGFFTFRVDVDTFPSEEATSEVRITYPPPPTPTPTPAPVSCARPLDLFFAIDGSGSLGSNEFTNEINFVIDIIRSFNSPRNRYGYVIFATEIQSTANLNSNASAVIEKLRGEEYKMGGTQFLPPLNQIFSTHFTPDNKRVGASRVLFFITDGMTEGDFSPVLTITDNLNTLSSVEIITVGFGNPDFDQLSMIATNNNSFNFSNIDSARSALSMILAVACPSIPSCCEGPIGFRGERGPAGYRGDLGANAKNGICVKLEECILLGLRGRKGMQGLPGIKGATGNAGSNGDTGIKGDPGDLGSSGQDGNKGDKGSKGDPNIRADKGSRGSPGEKGSTGDNGDVGENGDQGLRGQEGETGQPGVCNVPECIGEKGELGATGPTGLKGFPGSPGIKGLPGSSGDKGGVGLKGNTGLPGIKGDVGDVGEAIEKSPFQAGNCTTDGSLLYDTDNNRIYYCSMGQYLCVGKEPCNG